MMTPVLPLIAFALGAGVPEERVTTPHAAQARLAEALADADSVEWARANGDVYTFAIDYKGEAFLVVATTRDHEVVSLAIRHAGRASVEEPQDALGWVVGEMHDAQTVTRLDVRDGRVMMSTGEGRRYLMLPGHGTNAAVEARWAAEWDNA
jgi:hypothetical protein